MVDSSSSFQESASLTGTNRTAQRTYMQDHLQRLHNDIEATTRRLELEKRRLKKLDEDVVRVRAEQEEKIRARARDSGGSGYPGGEVSVRKMEVRLSKATAQLNALGHENADVRAKIDQVRRERIHMNAVFKKCREDVKESICGFSQQQRDAEATRYELDETLNRTAALRKHLENERRQFKVTVRELQKTMQDREREEQVQKAVQSKRGALSSEVSGARAKSLKADEEEHFDAVSIMRYILKTAFLNTIQRRHIKQHQKNIEVFGQAFATIKSITGISEVEEIVKIFLAIEQRNFSLLTYANTLNHEVEAFERHNHDLAELLKTKVRIDGDCEKEQASALLDVSQKIESAAASAAGNLRQDAELVSTLERCRPMVKALLEVVEAEDRGLNGDAARDFGGDSVLAWLFHIETTINLWKELLPESRDIPRVRIQVMNLPPKTSTPLIRVAELPSSSGAPLEGGHLQRLASAGREEESSDEDEDLQSHPFSRQELREKAALFVAKRRRHRKKAQDSGGRRSDWDLAIGDLHQSESPPAESAAEVAETAELGYDDLVGTCGADSDTTTEANPAKLDIDDIYRQRYGMSCEELQTMADKIGVQLDHLCYLKQEFDAHDEDKSGCIDATELQGLLARVGVDLEGDDLDRAFQKLDQDNSGEIEFFEFAEWLTSEG